MHVLYEPYNSKEDSSIGNEACYVKFFSTYCFDMRRNVTVGEKIPSVFWGDLEKYMWGLLIREGIPGRDGSIDL